LLVEILISEDTDKIMVKYNIFGQEGFKGLKSILLIDFTGSFEFTFS